MRFDLISIFPDYFAPLTLSLMGKAEDAGLVTLAAHDLRQWATGKHRSVDDTPYGGGAGMVMRADVWARALDDALATPLACENAQAAAASCRRVLAIPTPSGTPLTQPVVEDLARADQIIVACGRYEGIDARVAEHYRGAGVEVVEFSIGDYVLNGGEVAAMVLTEAVARLLDGFMGNPDSLVEESHSGAGLLEYPVFTKPREFRSLEIPEVLLGGNHAAIERWRRDRAIEKTAAVRPDLALELRAESLGREDRATLAACGVAYPREGSARGRGAAHVPDALVEELDRPVVGLGLNVLGQGDRHGTGLGRVGQDAHAAQQRGDQLLGTVDAVEEARDGAERVVDGDVQRGRILELLKDRVGDAGRELVGGEDEDGQAVGRRGRRAGHHVQRAGADRRGGDPGRPAGRGAYLPSAPFP